MSVCEFGMFCPTHGWKGFLSGFCDTCGTRLEERRAPNCFKCGRAVLHEFCSHCGAKMPKREGVTT